MTLSREDIPEMLRYAKQDSKVLAECIQSDYPELDADILTFSTKSGTLHLADDTVCPQHSVIVSRFGFVYDFLVSAKKLSLSHYLTQLLCLNDNLRCIGDIPNKFYSILDTYHIEYNSKNDHKVRKAWCGF